MEHTRNQKRMYRIKKLEERIVDLENISKKAISELTIANDKQKKIKELIKTNVKDDWSIVETGLVWEIEKIIEGSD